MSARPRIRPRVARLARQRSARPVVRAVRRELTCRGIERALARAHDPSTGPVLIGPFLGEVGFELLYWIPFVRRLLTEHQIDPARVSVLARGGAGAWYADVAAESIEVLDLIDPDEFAGRLKAQRRHNGHARQLSIGELDRELLARAAPDVGPATVLHPIVAYTRLRHVWDGLQPVSALESLAVYRRLDPVVSTADLPQPYVAVKPYFSSCFPDTQENRAFLRGLVDGLSESTHVVLLTTGLDLDDHAEWAGAGGSNVTRLDGYLEARDNLAVQSAVVAGATTLYTTYGGFSYLGALIGVPTVAYFSEANFNRVHLDALTQLVRPEAYEVRHTG